MQKKKKINLPVVMGSIIIIFFVVIALLAPYIAPYDPAATSSLTYAKPSAEHWLGTNDVGQDIFSELLYGTRISMGIGVFAAFVVTILGTVLALFSGICGQGCYCLDQSCNGIAGSCADNPSSVLFGAGNAEYCGGNFGNIMDRNDPSAALPHSVAEGRTVY